MKMNKLLSVLISAALTASTFTFPAMAEENTEKSYDEIFTPASVENTEDMTVEMFDVEQWLTEGDGTEENPYMISSAEVLSQLADEVNGGNDCSGIHFKLSSDIDLSSVCGADLDGEEVSWIPIGAKIESIYMFNGIFDGDGHEIKNLYINNEEKDSLALFGNIGENGTIKNLIVSGNVTGIEFLGGIAGVNYGVISNCINNCDVTCKEQSGGVVGFNLGKVEDCINNGTVSGVGAVGGIVGDSKDCQIINCINKGAIEGGKEIADIVDKRIYIGGIAGCMRSGEITKCQNLGSVNGLNCAGVGGIAGIVHGVISDCSNNTDVTGKRAVGGIAGFGECTISRCVNLHRIKGENKVGGIAGTNYSEIINCYNAETVEGVEDAGGIAGENKNIIENCYNIGQVFGTSIVGGIVGKNNNTDNVPVGCYYLVGTAEAGIFEEQDQDGVTKALTVADFAQQSDFSGWDFENVWEMNTFFGRPFLKNCPEEQIYGDGTEENPYLITNVRILEALRNSVNNGVNYSGKYFKLTADIDLSSVCGDDLDGEEISWIPIGKRTGTSPDVISADDKPFSGIFDGNGYKVSGLYINGTNDFCGLFGYIKDGAVKNLTVSGSITGKDCVGGIAGWNSAVIENCVNNCVINGSKGTTPLSFAAVGGIAGTNFGTILCCYNNETISSVDNYLTSDYIGGICGENYGTVENCYNKDIIEGRFMVGGIAGNNTNTIRNCYNYGYINAEYNAGGISGGNESIIENCFYDEEKSEKGVAVETGAQKTETYKKSYSEFKNGSVAYLLQKAQKPDDNGSIPQVWGQKIIGDYFVTDRSPVLSGDSEKTVYKVTFATQSNAEYAVEYANADGVYQMPMTPSGSENSTFLHWSVTASADGETFTDTTPVTGDMTVYAVKRDSVQATDANDVFSYKWGDTITPINLNDYIENKTEAENDFVFSLNPDSPFPKGLTLSEDGIVSGTLESFGNYTIVFDVVSKSGISLMSVDDNKSQLTLYMGIEYTNGKGTEDEPYLISSLETLMLMRDAVNIGTDYSGKYFKQTTDIDLSSQYGPNFDTNGRSWPRIGTIANPFYGTYDGDGHRIDNLYINGKASYRGFFGYIGDGTVKNLTVSGRVTSNDRVGGIVGYLEKGTVENCVNEVNVTGGTHKASVISVRCGGIVGLAGEATIKNCVNKGTVKNVTEYGGDETGGIVGSGGDCSNAIVIDCINLGSVNGVCCAGGIIGANWGTRIESCINQGNISLEHNTKYYVHAGGITGINYGPISNCINIGDVDNVNDGTAFIGGVVGSNCSEIINCYNAGDVKGADNVGGIAGENNNKIENCYNIGYVKGYVPESKVGGIVGKNDNTDTDNVITGCYYLFGTADAGIFEEQDQEGVTKALTVADFAQQSNFSGWDFENIWEMNTVFGRPCLKNCLEEQFYGDGTEDNPYLITNARMLEALRNSVNNGENYSGKYFKLTEDIDLSLVCGADVDGTEMSWTPIGMRNNTTFDESADDKPFSGIFDGNGHKISSLYINGTNDFCGLFGYIKDGAVKNLTVSGSIVGKDCVGGIAGWNSGVIETCVSKCSVTGSKGNQPMSYASVGGIAGLNEGTISCCYNINTISSVDNSLTSDSVGGICGDNYGIIENCFNTGEVSGRFLIGGIAGNNTKTIKNCYSIGIITAEAHAGGITADNGSVVENSYYLEGTSEKGVIYTNNAEKTEIESKTAAEFAGGSVAYLLQSAQTEGSMIWGQTLDAEGADSYPVLSNDNAKSVYKVTFVSNNSEYSASYANPNRTVTLPEAPKVSGYTFVKWAKTNSSDGEEFTAETPVTENMTVYAVTKRTSSGGGSGSTSYTVTFETNGGSKISSVKVTRNDAVSAPTSPTKDGYTFDGWYSDKALTEAYDFTAKVTKSFTIYAKWTENEKEQDKPTNPDNPVNPQWENPFNDVKENDWFYSNVEYAVKNSLFNGTSDTSFEPNGLLTRAMLVTVLWRAEGKPQVNYAMPFDDVDIDGYYAEAVRWAAIEGIIMGVSENKFGSNENITREQIAAIMFRYAKYKGYDVSVGENTNILSYTDAESISEYAVESVQYAVGAGLMTGKTDTTINPKDNATRAEIAAILQRFIEANK